MKRLLMLATVMLLAVAALGAMSTGAWFVSSAQVQNVPLDAGSLVVVVTEPIQFIPATDFIPGGPSQLLGVADVVNNGSTNMKFRAWFGEVQDPAGLANYLTATVTMNPQVSPGSIGAQDVVVCSNVPFNDLLIAGNACLTQDTLSMAFGDDVSYQVEVALSASAPDSVQGATMVANFDFYATQFINPGW